MSTVRTFQVPPSAYGCEYSIEATAPRCSQRTAPFWPASAVSAP
ncbi:hypothetical protein AB0K74_10430 [Streptomyces sp. NPDC056159]